MADFGKWQIYDKDFGYLFEEFGFVDLEKMLFVGTDENKILTGRIINLNFCAEWKKVK